MMDNRWILLCFIISCFQVFSLKFDPDTLSLISHEEFFEVAGDVQPITIWIEHQIFEHDMTDEFPGWICNDKRNNMCITSPSVLPDISLFAETIHSSMNQENKSKVRGKRFIGTLIGGLLGLGGLIDTEFLRHQTNSKFQQVSSQIQRLQTGIHQVNEELIHHIQLTDGWRHQIQDYLHINFDKQEQTNSHFLNEVINLWDAITDLSEESHQLIEDTRRKTIALAKLTSSSLSKVVQKISTLNSVIDLLIWTDMKNGKLPSWVFALPAFKEQLLVLIQQMRTNTCQDPLIQVEELISLIMWTPLYTQDKGLLMGSLLPDICHVGVIKSLNVPPVCGKADDGGYYTTQLVKGYIQVSYNGSVYYKSQKYLDSCQLNGVWKSCPHPSDTPVLPSDHQCGQSLFSGRELQHCVVTLSHCQKEYQMSRVRSTFLLSGGLLVKSKGKILYQGDDLLYVVPLQSSYPLDFYTNLNEHILTVKETTQFQVLTPRIVPLTTSWKDIVSFDTLPKRNPLPHTLRIAHLNTSVPDIISNQTQLIQNLEKLIPIDSPISPITPPDFYELSKLTSLILGVTLGIVLFVIIVVMLVQWNKRRTISQPV